MSCPGRLPASHLRRPLPENHPPLPVQLDDLQHTLITRHLLQLIRRRLGRMAPRYLRPAVTQRVPPHLPLPENPGQAVIPEYRLTDGVGLHRALPTQVVCSFLYEPSVTSPLHPLSLTQPLYPYPHTLFTLPLALSLPPSPPLYTPRQIARLAQKVPI